jgi:pyruvate-formate lyase-activating enzyme
MNMRGEILKAEDNRVSDLVRTTKQCVRGIPYLQKEFARRLSLSVGRPLTTPTSYYVIFSGRCNLECTFCEIYKHPEPMLSRASILVSRRTASL